MDRYTGVKVVEGFTEFQSLYEQGSVSTDVLDKRSKWYPNQCLVLKCEGKDSALGRVSPQGDRIYLVKTKREFFGVNARNKEQHFLMDLLADESIKVLAVTGKAGTGKSLLIGAYICDLLLSKKVEKVVISKPMEVVTTSRYFGIVPGDTSEKFDPFLLNFKYLLQKLAGEKGKNYFDLFQQKGQIEFMPLELMRGVSFGDNTIVYLDEAQNISPHVIKTLGTRMGEESRLFMSGDFNQVDIQTKGFTPGLLTVVDSEIYKSSPISAQIHLLKIERGVVAELFAKIYGDA